ncbi:MAG: hypothetical protein ACTHLE_04695 [Agriterribacter sp.]
MDDNSLKSAWKNAGTSSRTQDEIKHSMQEKNHAVLKKVRRQMIIEIAGFTIFLFLYYDMFDGNNKPLYANVLLVISLLLVIAHNAIVYSFAGKSAEGHNIKQLLQTNISRLKMQGAITVILRIAAAASLLVFFVSVISLTPVKYWLLAGIAIIYVVQLWLLAIVQRKRLQQLQQVLSNFEE